MMKTLISLIALASLTSGIASAGEPAVADYLLRGTGISCFRSPCPYWEVLDPETRERISQLEKLNLSPLGLASDAERALRVKLDSGCMKVSGQLNAMGPYGVLRVTALHGDAECGPRSGL